MVRGKPRFGNREILLSYTLLIQCPPFLRTGHHGHVRFAHTVSKLPTLIGVSLGIENLSSIFLGVALRGNRQVKLNEVALADLEGAEGQADGNWMGLNWGEKPHTLAFSAIPIPPISPAVRTRIPPKVFPAIQLTVFF